MKHKILKGTIDNRYFVITISDDSKLIEKLEESLYYFFEQYKTRKLKEKTKKETDHGYLSVSGSSRRK